jgi:hypothetical protein
VYQSGQSVFLSLEGAAAERLLDKISASGGCHECTQH